VSLTPDSEMKIKEINTDYFYDKFIPSVNKNSKVGHSLLDDGYKIKIKKINQNYFFITNFP
jgi:hypothetical protein